MYGHSTYDADRQPLGAVDTLRSCGSPGPNAEKDLRKHGLKSLGYLRRTIQNLAHESTFKVDADGKGEPRARQPGCLKTKGPFSPRGGIIIKIR